MTLPPPHLRFRSGIYLLVDPDVLPVERWGAVLAPVLEQDLALVQLRVKNRPQAATEAMAQRLQGWCQKARRPLLINDDVGLALQVGAAGVHLGQSDGDIAHARERLGPGAIIGRTCHDDLALVSRAVSEGADYASIGALFPSHTKPAARTTTLPVLHKAAQRGDIPICAIGGIDAASLPQVVSQGASLVAVCGAVLRADNPAEAARRLVRLFADERQYPAV